MVDDRRICVVIAGSYSKHLSRIFSTADAFEAAGAKVLRPTSRNVIDTVPFTRLEGDPPDIASIRELQYEAIRKSDLLYVVNPGGLVGSDALIECGFALGQGVPVIFSDIPFEAGAQKLATGWGTPYEALQHAPGASLLPSDREILNIFCGNSNRITTGSPLTGGSLTIRSPRVNVWQLIHDPDSSKPHLVARKSSSNEYQMLDPKSTNCKICLTSLQFMLADLEHGPSTTSIVETVHE